MSSSPEASFLHASFRHEAWLLSYPLDEHSALAYFEWSPWYDRGCINEQLKAEGLPAASGAHLAGVSYTIRRGQAERGGLFVVEKRISRGGGDEAVPVAFWAIVEGTIYPAPDLGTLVAGRIARAAHHVAAATALLTQHALDVEASEAAAAAAAEEGGGGVVTMATPAQYRRQIDAILAGLAGAAGR